MPICKYSRCKKEFTPNPRNRTKNPQEFCDSNCRWKHWNEQHPRVGVMPKPMPSLKRRTADA